MKHVAIFLAGLGVAFLVGLAFRRPRAQQMMEKRVRRPALDLNHCSIEELTLLGLDNMLAKRIIENRPYRNKLELVSRVMLPNDVYALIRRRVTVSGTREAVKVAS